MIATSNKRSNKSGFSLLEVIISMALITTALMAVFKLQGQNLDLQSEARFVTIATQLAQNRIHQIESAGEGLQEGTSSGDFGDDFPHYYYRQEIEQVPDFERLLKVTVSVVLEKEKVIRDLSAETYIYR
jgi:general secretion pathway protein I